MIVKALMILVCTALAMLFVWLGYAWTFEGYGLNPWISLPAALVSYSLPLYVMFFDTEWVPDE